MPIVAFDNSEMPKINKDVIRKKWLFFGEERYYIASFKGGLYIDPGAHSLAVSLEFADF